ncbi:MAG: EF-hand domain-containing protein [bacterium]
MKSHAAWIVAAVLCAGVVVQAEEPAKADQPKRQGQPPPEEMYKKIDTNGDGQISLDEFKASMAERAKSRPNAREIPVEMVEKRFKALDADSNGSVSLEEFKKGRMDRPRGEGAPRGDHAPKAPEAKPVAPASAPAGA